MGILDDAIRQHLDLKRRTGADESELKQLEDEAFGPPARPGDPDFPGSETDGEGAVAAGEEPSAGEEAAVLEPADQEPPHGDALLEEAEAEAPEPPPGVDEPVADPAATSFTTAEREAIAAQPTEFFDQPEGEGLELGELDLPLDQELEEAGRADAELEVTEETAPAEETGLVEEPAEETEPAGGAEPLSDELEVEPAPEPAEGEAAQDEEAEDVLEETPEFLRDNPDDDELWFEQGEPKDFDF